jgi:hypothetical protein
VVGVAHPIENYIDEGGVASEGFADPDSDVRMPFPGALDLRRDVFSGVAPGSEEVRMHDDLGRASFHAGVDPRGDIGFGDFQMGDFDDRIGRTFADLLGDVFEQRVRFRAPTAVVDEQDRAFH